MSKELLEKPPSAETCQRQGGSSAGRVKPSLCRILHCLRPAGAVAAAHGASVLLCVRPSRPSWSSLEPCAVPAGWLMMPLYSSPQLGQSPQRAASDLSWSLWSCQMALKEKSTIYPAGDRMEWEGTEHPKSTGNKGKLRLGVKTAPPTATTLCARDLQA